MEKKWFLDGEEISWQSLIDKACDMGYFNNDNFYCTSEAAEILIKNGHSVEQREK